MAAKDLQEQLHKQKQKNDQLTQQVKEIQNQMKVQEQRAKVDRDKLISEKEDLQRQL